MTTKLWKQIEQAQSDITLKSALWCYDSLPPGLKSHPLLGTTLRHGSQVIMHSSLTSSNSPLFPILGHPNFTPGLHSVEFDILRGSGTDHAAKFVIAGSWPTLPELTEVTGKYQLPFWKAVQLHHLLHLIPGPQDLSRPLTTFEEYCTGTEPLAKPLSKMYSLLNTPSIQPHLPCLERWERDLNRKFSETQKQTIIRCAFKSSCCTKIQETNYKILSRWYLTPSRLHKFFPATSDRCWRCGEGEGSLLHILWSCPGLQNFWREVRRIAQKFTEYVIPDDASFFLLHLSNIPFKNTKNL